jgi:hypothetical protein
MGKRTFPHLSPSPLSSYSFPRTAYWRRERRKRKGEEKEDESEAEEKEMRRERR